MLVTSLYFLEYLRFVALNPCGEMTVEPAAGAGARAAGGEGSRGQEGQGKVLHRGHQARLHNLLPHTQVLPTQQSYGSVISLHLSLLFGIFNFLYLSLFRDG